VTYDQPEQANPSLERFQLPPNLNQCISFTNVFKMYMRLVQSAQSLKKNLSLSNLPK